MIARMEMSAAAQETRYKRPSINTRRKLEWYRQEARDRAAGLARVERFGSRGMN
jgi:hypothetical protein